MTILAPESTDMPLFDPTDPGLAQNPYPAYARLRADGPAWRSAHGYWIVARHDEVSRLLRSRVLSSAQPGGEPGAPVGTLAEHGRWVMIASDPPDHGRRRGAVQPAFAAAAMAALGPRIEHHVRDCFDQIARERTVGETFDFVAEVASVIPVLTIAELLGLPVEDAPQIRAWTAAFTDGLEPWADEAAADRAGAALAEMSAYLEPVLAARSSQPADDLLSVLATSTDLGPEEKLQNGLLLLNAGLDTSTDLLGNLVAALAARPDTWAEVVADPHHWVPAAVEETMRFESPVQFSMRRTIGEVELGEAGASVTIPAGEAVLLGLGSANRDPDAHPDPEHFDPHRPGRHMGFGGGAHLCLGAPLARLEAVAVLTELATRSPKLELAGPAPWRPRVFFRGHDTVPLHLDWALL